MTAKSMRNVFVVLLVSPPFLANVARAEHTCRNGSCSFTCSVGSIDFGIGVGGIPFCHSTAHGDGRSNRLPLYCEF